MGLMGVKDSETNKEETLIKNSSSDSLVAVIGKTFITELEILAPADFDRAELSSKEKLVLTRRSLMLSKCFSNLSTPLSK